MPKNILFEVSPLVGNLPRTVRMAAASASRLGTHLDGYRWLPLVSEKPTIDYTLASDGLLSETEISYGSLSFRMSDLYENEEWASWEWTGALGRIWIGNDGDPFESYTKIFEGSVSSITREQITATVELLGPEALLDTNLLSLSYAGTGDVEGDTSMQGNLKPRAFGECLSVEPVCIDQAYQIYQVSGYGPVAQMTVYVFAEALTADQYLGDVADYAALAALTIDPGKFATCFAHGLFRLGADPTKKLSADIVPTGSLTLDKIVPELLAAAGIPAALVGDMSALATSRWSLFQTDQVSVGDAIRGAVQQAGCYLFADPEGVWQVGNYFDTSKAPVTLNRDRSSFPLVKTIKELNAAAPVYEVKIGYDKCWNVHTDDDVSPVLAGLSDEQSAALEQATEDAAQAVADAAAAAARLAAMECDGVLDRSEKARILRDFETETTAHDQLVNQASTFDVTAERFAYDARYNQLKTYLESLVPAYTDLDHDTPIDPVADNNAWKAYWIAKQIIEAALTGHAATTANWGDMVDDNGLLPEDGATKGAPAGTYVASKPATDLVNDVDSSKAIILTLPDIIAREIATPIDKLSQIALIQNTANLKTSRLLDDKTQTAISTLSTAVDDLGNEVSEQLTLIRTSVNDSAAAIEDIKRTTSSNDASTANAITLMTARVNKAAADLANETSLRVSADAAQIDINNQLSTKITTEAGTRESAINSVKSLVSNVSAAQATTIDQLTVKVTTEGKNRQSDIQDLRKVIADADASLAEQITSLSSSTTTSIGGFNGTLSDLSGRIDQYGNTVVDLTSKIQDVRTTQTNDNQARASEIQSLQSTVGTNSSSIRTTQDTLAGINGNLQSTWGLQVQTDSNGVRRVAGIKAYADGNTSALVFDADQFAMYVNGGTQRVFGADADGVTMPNVKVGKLQADTIVAAHINPGVVTATYNWNSSDIYIPSSETTIIETPYFRIGDGDYGVGTAQVSFVQDGSQTNDTAIRVRAYVDTGSGYSLYRNQLQGIRVKSGDGYWSLPVSFPIFLNTTQQVRIKITAMGNEIGGGGNLSGSYCRSIEVDIFRGQR